MKKLVIILWLIISTVAFGKPAYKQWSKSSVKEEFKKLDTSVAGVYAPEYIYSYKKGKKDGSMSTAVYVYTNRLSYDKADVVAVLMTSEPIDFSVGKNSVFLGRIMTNKQSGETSSVTPSSAGSLVYTIAKAVPKTVVTTNKQLTASFVSNGLVDGFYQYAVRISNLHPETFAYVDFFIEPSFKNPYTYKFDLSEVARQYWRVRSDKKQAEEDRVLAEQKKKADIKAGQNARFEALKKRYTVKYSATLNGYEVYSKKGGHGDGLHARFGLLVNQDTDGTYKASYLQFMVLQWQTFPSIMSVGAFYTEGGEYVIRKPIGNGYVGELGWKRPNGQVQYMFNYYILYDKSDNLQYLEKMINSGKKLYIEFGGQGEETIKHWLYGVEIEQLKDLVNFIKELHGEGL